MCTIRIKRTNSGNFDPSITRGELNYDYFTNTLFVGTGDGTAVRIARKVDGATGANLFLPENDDLIATQESAKAYIDSIIDPLGSGESPTYEYLGVTASRQPVAYSLSTDTVVNWASATIYEQTDNVGLKFYDVNDIFPDYAGFFQDEVDIMYVKVNYSLLLSDVGENDVAGDTYENASRFCAIKLLDKFNEANTTRYFGAQKVPPSLSSRLIGSYRLPTMVSGTGIVPLPRRTAENPWEIQIVTRWLTNAPQGYQFVGGLNDSSLDEFDDWEEIIFGERLPPNQNNYGIFANSNGINVQLQRLM